MSESCVLPDFSLDEAAAVARSLFMLDGNTRALDGERDLNFLIETSRGKFVFKIANADEDPAMLECQHQVFERLAGARVMPALASALESVHGRTIETVQSAAGIEHACRALPFVEGRMLSTLGSLSPALLRDLGQRLGQLDLALQDYDHPALERPLLWKMDNALDVLEDYKPLLANDNERKLVDRFEMMFRRDVLPRLGEMRRAVIHNDANRANVLVDESGEKVVTVIDFGDMVVSWLVVEPAIAATYVMLDNAAPIAAASSLVRGYHAVLPLQRGEAELLFDFICMRLCTSVCIAAHQTRLTPDNEYLGSDVASAWALLNELAELDIPETRQQLLTVCGFE